MTSSQTPILLLVLPVSVPCNSDQDIAPLIVRARGQLHPCQGNRNDQEPVLVLHCGNGAGRPTPFAYRYPGGSSCIDSNSDDSCRRPMYTSRMPYRLYDPSVGPISLPAPFLLVCKRILHFHLRKGGLFPDVDRSSLSETSYHSEPMDALTHVSVPVGRERALSRSHISCRSIHVPRVQPSLCRFSHNTSLVV